MKRSYAEADHAQPLVSVITATLDRGPMLSAAIDSVRRQTYANVEHIIVDGGSRDDTAARVASYPHITYISEPDRGVYDAVNKGIARARGAIIGILNSDDVYVGEAIGEAAALFRADPAIGVVSGGAEITTRRAGRWQPSFRLDDDAAKSLAIRPGSGPPSLVNARFFRREIFDAVGFFDIRYSLAADLDFMIRLTKLAPKHATLDGIVYEYRQHAGSKTLSGQRARKLISLDECLAIARHYARDPSYPEATRAACRAWHAWLVGWGTSTATAQANLGQALAVTASGLRWDPACLAIFVRQLPAYWAMRRAIRAVPAAGPDDAAPADDDTVDMPPQFARTVWGARR